MRILRTILLAATMSSFAMTASAGSLSAPDMESDVAAPEDTFVPPQGSVNGGYLVLGALALMALLASNI